MKAARLSGNITIDQVAQATRISHRHLRNLEEGHYPDLPGGMYNRAFLRSYCEYLGLDADSFLERYERETTPQSERTAKSKTRNSQISSRSFSIPPLLIWSFLFLASVAGLYYSRGWIAAVFSPYFSPPPAVKIPPVQPALSVTSGQSTQAAQADASATPPAAAPKIEPPAAEVLAEAGKTQPASSASESSMIRLQFEAVQQCWISVFIDSQRSQTMTLQPGDSQSFDGKESLLVILGNAGGVTLQINGKPAKSLGNPGEVVRVLINAQTIPDWLQKLIG